MNIMNANAISSLNMILTGLSLMVISTLIIIATYVIPRKTVMVIKTIINLVLIVIVAIYIIATPIVSLLVLIWLSAYELKHGKVQSIDNVKKIKSEVEFDSYMMTMRQGTNWVSITRFTVGLGREIFRQEVLIGNLITIRFLEFLLFIIV